MSLEVDQTAPGALLAGHEGVTGADSPRDRSAVKLLPSRLPSGSSNKSEGRTFRAVFRFAFLARSSMKLEPRPPKTRRNPIFLAREWHGALKTREVSSRAACEHDRECYGVQSRPIDSDSGPGALTRVPGAVGDQPRWPGLGTLLSKPK